MVHVFVILSFCYHIVVTLTFDTVDFHFYIGVDQVKFHSYFIAF